MRYARCAAVAFGAFLSAQLSAHALGIASFSQSGGTSPVTWANAGTADVYLASDGPDPITITGTMQTTPLTGSGSITISAPSSLSGGHGAPFNLAWISVTCTGPAIGGQTFVANDTPLIPGGSVTCATYGPTFLSTNVQVTISLYLDDRTLPADVYTSNSTALTISATAS